MSESKPELKHCNGICNSYTPHIIISKQEKKQKICLVCCKRTKFNEETDRTFLEPLCEYCSLPICFNADKNRYGRRFCRNGRCATNQNKFMKTWHNQSIFKINIKIKELRDRLSHDKMFEGSEMWNKMKYAPLSPDKIGIYKNQIAMLYNIKEGQRLPEVEIQA
jgi:hypothetical protein